MKDYFKVVCAVHLFLIRDGKVLLLRRFNTGYEDGNYSVIAGHIDGGETARSATVREAAEEVGIMIDPDDLRFVHIMHRKARDHERVDFFFTCDKWRGGIRNSEPERCDELKWSSIDSPPSNMVPYVRHAFNNFKNNIFFSEFGW